MTDCCRPAESPIASHFGRSIADSDWKRYERKGPNTTTRHLRDGIVRAGTGESVLDVGAGICAASFELLAAGYSSAVACDLSAAALAVARCGAQKRGVADRLTVHEGDFVEVAGSLPSGDTVVLDRVVCCYPEFQPLLRKALEHSNRLFAFSYPRDRWYVRAVFAFENLRRSLGGDRFRTFLHSTVAMEELIMSKGFHRVSRKGTVAWTIDLYARTAG